LLSSVWFQRNENKKENQLKYRFPFVWVT
jgi:hypothetical protein